MPKERRSRTASAHQPAVRPSKRRFAVQDNQVERVEVGGFRDVSGNDLLKAIDQEQEPAGNLTKKEKHQLKREIFLHRLGAGQAPYSKSHTRRLKRRAREEIGGGLDEIKDALEEAVPEAVRDSTTSEEPQSQKGVKPKPGQIGEGKKAPMSQSQRKRALQTEKTRHPLILSNPQFASNPFATIRRHAENTLVKHQRPST